jgi:Rrf2 family protein
MSSLVVRNLREQSPSADRVPTGVARMLTRKGKYGLKAAVYLARLPPGQPAAVTAIAQANKIPKRFLDVILAELRHADVLHNKRGKGGGYMLARPPDKISIGEIIRTLDGQQAPIACANRNFYQSCSDCADHATCPVRLMMIHVRDAISRVIDHHSLAQMRDLTADDMDNLIRIV